MRRGRRQSDIHGVHKLANSHIKLLPAEMIARSLAPFGLQPSAALVESIREYIDLLLCWNRKISLTSVVDRTEILRRHFGESMFGAIAVPMTQGRLVDVGSGAGFPGLAVKMISPDLEVTLVEANLKKAAFLGEVVRALRLTDVKILTKRAADLRADESGADFVTCRAVRPDKKLLVWMHNALRAGGKCILWLGDADAIAIRERRGWNWKQPIEVPLSLKRVLQVGERE